ncbi:RAM signaling pathway protein-domain-containing protein, partial [Parasitella parasitica]
MKRNLHPQRLPPLNVATRMDTDTLHKHNESDAASYFHRVVLAPNSSSKAATSHIIEASQIILFTSSSLQRTVGRCIGCIGNDSLYAAFSPVLHKSKASTERLMAILDTSEKRPTTDMCHELVQATSACISTLKELCWTLRTRLSTLVQGLDAKFSRNLLMNLYSATVDMKDAWLVISPYLSVDPMQTLTSFMQPKPSSTTPTTPLKSRPHNELSAASSHSPSTSPLSSPNIKGDNTQLYTHLRNAVASSLHVLNTLKQSIEDTVQDSKTTASLENKLNELLRQTQYATELSHRLDKNVEANMGTNKEDLLLLPTRKESSRRIWEDTSIYLKAIVSVMSFIRSISTEEEFAWPKSIKQGCLYVTRMTAEVAKLWNSSSTFAEDGFFLGRQERSPSVSEQ